MITIDRVVSVIKKKLTLARIAILTAVLLFLVAIMSTCMDFTGKNYGQPAAQSPERITFAGWGNPMQREILKTVAKEFYLKNRIHVDVYCFSDAESCRSKVLTQFAAGDAFDVFYADDYSFNLLSEKGWLMDLTELSSRGIINKNDFYPEAYEKGIFADKLYGLPAGINPTVIYYNSRLFKQAGLSSPQELYDAGKWTLQELIAACKEIAYKKRIYGMAIQNDWTALFSIIKSSWTGYISYDKDGSILAGKEAAEALRSFKAMLDNGQCLYMGSKPKGVTEDELFKSEKVAMVLGGYEYVFLLGDVNDLEWDIVPFPSDKKGPGISALNIPIVSAAASTKKPAAARSFLTFYTSAAGQKARIENKERLMPSIKFALQPQAYDIRLPQHSQYFYEMLSQGFTEDTASNYLRNRDTLFSALNGYWSGDRDMSPLLKSR